MGISVYSYIMGIFWFNIWVILIFVLIRRNYFVDIFNIKIIYIFIFCCFFRIIFSIELPFTKIIHSAKIYPFVFDKLYKTFILDNLNVVNLLTIISLTISIFLFLHQFIKYNKFKKYINIKTSSTTDKAQEIYSKVLNDLNICKPPILIQNSNIIVPFHTGFFKPIIGLPNYYLSETELYYVIKHEVIHYISNDIWIKWFGTFMMYLWWWNPFMHILAKDLEKVLEFRCDIKVCENLSEIDRVEYAQTILKVMKNIPKKETKINCYLNSMAKGGQHIIQRFNIILYNFTLNYKSSRKRFIIFIVPFMLLMSYTFSIQPYYSPMNDDFKESSIMLNSENAYIIYENNTYYIYVNNILSGNIKETEIENFQLMKIPIQ